MSHSHFFTSTFGVARVLLAVAAFGLALEFTNQNGVHALTFLSPTAIAVLVLLVNARNIRAVLESAFWCGIGICVAGLFHPILRRHEDDPGQVYKEMMACAGLFWVVGVFVRQVYETRSTQRADGPAPHSKSTHGSG